MNVILGMSRFLTRGAKAVGGTLRTASHHAGLYQMPPRIWSRANVRKSVRGRKRIPTSARPIGRVVG